MAKNYYQISKSVPRGHHRTTYGSATDPGKDPCGDDMISTFHKISPDRLPGVCRGRLPFFHFLLVFPQRDRISLIVELHY